MDQPLGVRFEIADAEPAAAPVAAKAEAPRRAAASVAPASPMPVDNSNVIRLTDDIKSRLYADPLIRAIVDQLGGSIIKLEE